MDIVLSHTTALAAYRAGIATRPAADSRLPAKAPGAAEVLAWRSASTLAGNLPHPLTLLVGESDAHTKNSVYRTSYSSPLPKRSLVAVTEEVRIVTPELLALQMARVATTTELAMLVSELCGLYAIRPDTPTGLVQRARPLTSASRIDAYLKELGGVPGIRKLRSACALSFDRSGSPMESKLAARVSWPRSKGEYAVPILAMNDELEVRRITRNLSNAQVRKPDLLFSLPHEGKPGLCLDYHGDIHHGEGRPEQDALRVNELLAFGLQPYTLWHDQYQGTAYLDGLIDGVVRQKLGLTRHRPNESRATLELARRELLLAELNAVDGMSWGTSDSSPEALLARERVDEALSRL